MAHAGLDIQLMLSQNIIVLGETGGLKWKNHNAENFFLKRAFAFCNLLGVMNKQNESNTVFVLQKAIRFFKLKIATISVREFLLSHPNYPTLKSVCDALNHWNIANYP